MEDLSVTDSTTSKFEKLEQLVQHYTEDKSSQKKKIRYRISHLYGRRYY